MNSKEIARMACEALEDKKALEVKIINIEKVSTLADYFIIASGSNRNQVQAMADNVEEILGRAQIEPKQIEGYQNANWILMDYRDVVIHIFDEENRLFYDLERIWRDGSLIEKEELDKLNSLFFWIICYFKGLPYRWLFLYGSFCCPIKRLSPNRTFCLFDNSAICISFR